MLIKDFIINKYNFLLSEDLFELYLFSMFILLFFILIDYLRLKRKITIEGKTYYFGSVIIIIFFTYLYLYFSQLIAPFIRGHQSGLYMNDIKISEYSQYYRNTIGSSYNTGIIGLLSGIFASFFKLQLILIENKNFCKDRSNGSFFVTFIITLNIFSILIFIDQLKYSEFKFSEADVMHLNTPTNFFSLLIVTSLVIFLILLFGTKESILSKLIKKRM
jgi:hypothetical protein